MPGLKTFNWCKILTQIFLSRQMKGVYYQAMHEIHVQIVMYRKLSNKEGFQHLFCFTDTDHCDPDPCQNEATCRNQVDGYTCNCTAGYEGDNCETGG